ncbi:MAG: hypothetical protein ABH859_02810 [Pseudomonadota bacterium]
MKPIIKILATASFFIILASCGQTSGPLSTTNTTENGGRLQLTVKGSQSFNPNAPHGQIRKYQVVVSAPDLAEPVTAIFDGTATSGQINGIPVGSDRLVTVNALNPNSAIIRQGEQEGVQIKGGQTAQADITLESVPIFTNLANGNNIANTRLIFKAFADPASQVVIEDLSAQNAVSLVDASTSLPEVNLDISTGLGQLTPSLQPNGEHSYVIKDLNTNRSTTITVNLIDGSKLKPAPFFAAGSSLEPETQGRVSCGTY